MNIKKRYKRLFLPFVILSLCRQMALPAGFQPPEAYLPVPEWYHDYDVKYYKIDIEANNTSTEVKGNAEILAEVEKSGLERFTVELKRNIQVDSVYLDGKPVAFKRENDYLHALYPLHKGETYRIKICYAARPAPNDRFFNGISHGEDVWKVPVTWSLSEPDNAKDWFPCKQYLPDKADSAHIFITVPEHLKAGAPGILTCVRKMPGNKLRYEWKTNYPIAYYLISFAVSDYQEYITYAYPKGTSQPVKIQNYIYNKTGYLDANKAIIDMTGTLVELFSDLYLSYPFAKEKYGHCVAPMGGGMEHQTMTTLSEFDTLLVAHELAHQWFGDLVTCASFQDIWINEGFASYSEYLALEHLHSKAAAVRWMRQAHDRASGMGSGSVFVPKESAGDKWRIFNMNLTYKKGAALVHQIRRIINDDRRFFAVLNGFLDKYAFSTATAMDFKHFAEEQTGINFNDFFQQWYFGEGFPVFDISAKTGNGQLELLVEHTGSSPVTPLFTVDLECMLHSANGIDTLVKLPIRTCRDKFVLPIDQVNNITVDPDFHLLKKLRSMDFVKDFPTDDRYVHCHTHLQPKENLTVAFADTSFRKCRLYLTDSQGNTVLPETAAHETTVTLPAKNLPAGVYLLYVMSGESRYVRKIVKKNGTALSSQKLVLK
ncbi:MAG: T9SS type A sorting domain-containing protein [Bacteroidales bacterium]|jgi:aminopeptidase N|nr:T9SS type A sorting domain-containing protein [Bacteroidales bacterium]